MNKNRVTIGVILLVFLVSIFFLAFGYRSNTFERTMIAWINHNCKELEIGSCVMKLSDLTSFNWDRMYVTIDGNIPESLPDMVKLPEDKDISTRKIFFQYGNKLMLLEKMSTNIERPINNSIYFDIPDGKDYEEYTPESAIFSVKKIEGKYTYFQLTRIKK